MNDILSKRNREFGTYASALVDLKDDLLFMESNRYICNIDFTLYHPFFWSEQHGVETFSDRVRYNIFNSYIESASKSRMQFVFTRATIFEILTSIYSRLKQINQIYRNPNKVEKHQREIEKFLSDDHAVTAADYADKLREYNNLFPIGNSYNNIDTTVELLKKGIISSVYDVFGREEIKKLREEINKLTEEIAPKFYQRPSRNRYADPELRKIAKDVDCRNIAISMVLSDKFEEFSIPYFCAPYNVHHNSYQVVKRNHFVPGFWLEALKGGSGFNDGKIIAERMYDEALTCVKWLNLYREHDYSSLPDEAARDIGHFMMSYIEPLEVKSMNHKNDFSADEMRDRIAGKSATSKSFQNALAEKEAEFILKARSIISSFEPDEALLHETGLEDNPRAREILSTLESS